MAGVTLEILNETGRAVAGAWLREKLMAALKVLKVRRGEWVVKVVGDREMTRLHGETLGLWTTTDVLTFDLREGAGRTREGAAVELNSVICMDEARRRAGEMGHAVREELLLYGLHSLLHVQGYDDVTAAGAAAMHEREDEVLVAIGVGAVYGKPAGEARGSAASRLRAPRQKRKA